MKICCEGEDVKEKGKWRQEGRRGLKFPLDNEGKIYPAITILLFWASDCIIISLYSKALEYKSVFRLSPVLRECFSSFFSAGRGQMANGAEIPRLVHSLTWKRLYFLSAVIRVECFLFRPPPRPAASLSPPFLIFLFSLSLKSCRGQGYINHIKNWEGGPIPL